MHNYYLNEIVITITRGSICKMQAHCGGSEFKATSIEIKTINYEMVDYLFAFTAILVYSLCLKSDYKFLLKL